MRNRDQSIVHALPQRFMSFLWEKLKKNIHIHYRHSLGAILGQSSLSKRARYKETPGHTTHEEDLGEVPSSAAARRVL